MHIKSYPVNSQHSQVGEQNFASMNVKKMYALSGTEVYIVGTVYQIIVLQYNLLRGQMVRQVKFLSKLTWSLLTTFFKLPKFYP